MKLKVNKEKDNVLNGIKTIYSKAYEGAQCIISIDINGFVMIENFKKIKDYTINKIIIETKQKNVYIYGEQLKVITCNRQTATVNGTIQKIEIFDKEV
ncbi:MAG: YabP/YqfC family sporulation protein [Oscillospiraceae bacterium]